MTTYTLAFFGDLLDESVIVYRGHEMGWLTDVEGIAFNYAVRYRA